MKTNQKFKELVSAVWEHPTPFYRDAWGDPGEPDGIPQISRDNFIKTPLSKRRYKDEKALVKIIQAVGGAFLSEWSFDDIALEPFGLPSRRPMVYMSDSHESVEKAMWCYEHGMVPLVGESDSDIAAFAADKYRIDSLITDAAALQKLERYVHGRTEQLESITIIGTSFDLDVLSSYKPVAREMRLLIALPETGAIAHAQFSESPRFELMPDCLLENGNLFTKLRMLTTPVIRYSLRSLVDEIIS